MTESEERLNIFAWLLSILVAAIAITVWGQSLRWNIAGISTYQIFPVLGLVAFSLMWSHYIVSALRQYFGISKAATEFYFEATSWMVLIAIALHPGLLVWQLFRDGFGLPPASYERVYGWATLLGTVSLFIFFAYELRRKYAKRAWWKYVQYLSDAAMIAIFYHALKLGTQVHIDWFKIVWYFYGVTLIGSLFYIYAKKLTVKNQETAL